MAWRRVTFYNPTQRGFESRLKERLDAIREWIATRRGGE